MATSHDSRSLLPFVIGIVVLILAVGAFLIFG